MSDAKELLKIIGLKKYFGGLKAVDNVDLSEARRNHGPDRPERRR